MKERPILFSGEMVRAILDGRKTQTRRAIRDQSIISATEYDFGYCRTLDDGRAWWSVKVQGEESFGIGIGVCPYGVPGDRLWVRETWQHCHVCGYIIYRASANEQGTVCPHCDENIEGRWTPSIHMFKHYARIWLEITAVRIERLQEISDVDAYAEGCDEILLGGGLSGKPRSARAWFKDLWDSLNAKRGYGWDTNPWVWAVGIDVQPDSGDGAGR